jgi:hypothetical protein
MSLLQVASNETKVSHVIKRSRDLAIEPKANLINRILVLELSTRILMEEAGYVDDDHFAQIIRKSAFVKMLDKAVYDGKI